MCEHAVEALLVEGQPVVVDPRLGRQPVRGRVGRREVVGRVQRGSERRAGRKGQQRYRQRARQAPSVGHRREPTARRWTLAGFREVPAQRSASRARSADDGAMTLRRLVLALTLVSLLVAAAPAAAVTRHCSASGDVCYGAFGAGHATKLKLTLAAKYFNRYTLCVRAPSGTRNCRQFGVFSIGNGLFGSTVTWAAHFPAHGPGLYRATYRYGGASVAPSLTFARRPVDPGHAVVAWRPGRACRSPGLAGGCPAGNQVTLISHAFSHAHEFAGVSAVFATVRSDDTYAVQTRIPAGRQAGTLFDHRALRRRQLRGERALARALTEEDGVATISIPRASPPRRLIPIAKHRVRRCRHRRPPSVPSPTCCRRRPDPHRRPRPRRGADLVSHLPAGARLYTPGSRATTATASRRWSRRASTAGACSTSGRSTASTRSSPRRAAPRGVVAVDNEQYVDWVQGRFGVELERCRGVRCRPRPAGLRVEYRRLDALDVADSGRALRRGRSASGCCTA